MSIPAVMLVALVAAPAARAQSPSSPMGEAIKSAWDSAKRNITESAAQMPEENYAFKPTDSVRTFGQILAHVAGANYVFCSVAKGEQPPHTEDEFEKNAKTKADIVKALDGSIAYCDGAIAGMTDASGSKQVDYPYGMGKHAAAYSLILNTAHNAEHYGNLVTYFRIKGMVPPSTKRAM
jgi:uncharacterized damage-inducible protein DinB